MNRNTDIERARDRADAERWRALMRLHGSPKTIPRTVEFWWDDRTETSNLVVSTKGKGSRVFRVLGQGAEAAIACHVRDDSQLQLGLESVQGDSSLYTREDGKSYLLTASGASLDAADLRRIADTLEKTNFRLSEAIEEITRGKDKGDIQAVSSRPA